MYPRALHFADFGALTYCNLSMKQLGLATNTLWQHQCMIRPMKTTSDTSVAK